MASPLFPEIDWLIIAEKENQGKIIAQAIFDKGKPTGNLSANGHGLGGKNISSVLNGTVVIVRAQGHLLEMEYPDKQDAKYSRKAPEIKDDWGMVVGGGWKSDKEMLASYPIRLDTTNNNIKFKYRDSKSRTLAGIIKANFKVAKNIVVSTDGDAEGEMIFRNWLNQNIPKSQIHWERIYRIFIKALNTPSVLDAFKKTLERYDNMTDKLGKFYLSLAPQGFARSIADYEYGLTYSLLGNLVAKDVGQTDKLPVAPWGRIKNTVLGHVYLASKAHDEFKPSSSYRLDLKTASGQMLKSKQVFNTKEEALQAVKQLNVSQAEVKIVTEDKAYKPNKLFARSQLLIAANKQVGGGSDWGAILQDNYENRGILTYPRTDVQYITNEDYIKLQQYVSQSPLVKQLVGERLKAVAKKHNISVRAKWYDRPVDKRWVDDSKVEAHTALIVNPTQLPDKLWATLPQANKDLYQVALWQTMAMFMDDNIVTMTKAMANVAQIEFEGSFKTTKEDGWRLLVDEVQNDTQAPSAGLQNVSFVITEVPKQQPKLFTKWTLLDYMTKHKEATSATRDKIIDQMIKNKDILTYKGDKDGLRVNKSLDKPVGEMLANNWIDMETTSRWQKQLDDVHSMDDAKQFIEVVRQDTLTLQQQMTKKLGIEV